MKNKIVSLLFNDKQNCRHSNYLKYRFTNLFSIKAASPNMNLNSANQWIKLVMDGGSTTLPSVQY